MAIYRILNCKAGVCTAIGTIDVPAGVKNAVARSPLGDFAIEVAPFYVAGVSGKPGRIEHAIDAGTRSKTAWLSAKGVRSV